MDVLNFLKQHEGETFKTLDRKKPFLMKKVDSSGITIFIQSTKKERFISRSEIEGAYNDLWLSGEVTRGEIRHKHSEANPAYVAAMLSRLPNVTHQLRPIRLFLTRK